ncbi:MAG: FtsH protease activity modulator HflK [Gammaproteobacteria bacterium]|nr:FtsH protease activity modulator HflK [Gammaproteobacteria bacterium]
MAWNEPGGRDDDPWGGGRGGDQGPPDLDEAFRKLKNQLGTIFGGRGGSGGATPRISPGLVIIALVVLALLYGALGFYAIDQQERGVIFRFGAVRDDFAMPGLNWYPPLIDRVEKVNVTQVRSIQHQALMLTEDENIVDVSLTVQYQVQDPAKFLVEVANPEETLDHATESAIRHVAGSSSLDDIVTEGRAAVAVEVHERIQLYLDNYGTGIMVSKVNIDRGAPPAQVLPAFDDVQKAIEDEARVINEASAYAEGMVPEARGEAQRTIEQANAYRDQVIAKAEGEANRFSKLLTEYKLAPRVTRDRLYIDAMEDVMSNSTKVLIDVEGGNNMLYLPLDKLTQQSAAAVGGSQLSSEAIRQLTDSVVREIQNRSINTRRDNR